MNVQKKRALYIPKRILTPAEWTSEELTATTNCYAFALNFPVHPITGKEYHPLLGNLLQPGEISGAFFRVKKSLHEDTLMDLVKADIKKLGGRIEASNFNAPYDNSSLKIAVFLDPGKDFHFYRQSSDGTWYHKRGARRVSNKDVDGQIIRNPLNANRHYPPLNYQVFLGFYKLTIE